MCYELHSKNILVELKQYTQYTKRVYTLDILEMDDCLFIMSLSLFLSSVSGYFSISGHGAIYCTYIQDLGMTRKVKER